MNNEATPPATAGGAEAGTNISIDPRARLEILIAILLGPDPYTASCQTSSAGATC
jgi:hypothetical protein